MFFFLSSWNTQRITLKFVSCSKQMYMYIYVCVFTVATISCNAFACLLVYFCCYGINCKLHTCRCILYTYVIVHMYNVGYSEFRALLTAKAKALDDPVLCAVDLLLPKYGGWSRSHHLQNIKTRDFLARGGIIYSIDKDDQYIQNYLNYLNSKGLFEWTIVPRWNL